MAEPVSGSLHVVFDLTSAARWAGPPVGIVRVQRELAAYARRELPGAVFAVFDPRIMGFRRLAESWIDPVIGGRAALDAWALPDPTGGRRRRSEAVPSWLYSALQARRTSLRALERLRLRRSGSRLAGAADRLQRRLITRRYAPFMLEADGSRRAFLPPDLAFGEPMAFGPRDILVCTGFGWSHANIEAVLEARAAVGFRLVVMCADLIPLMFPQFFKPRDVEDLRRYWRAALPAADLVVVNARAVAEDVRRYGADAGLTTGPIEIAPLGADSASRLPADAPDLPQGLESGRYALFVSTIEPRKGHAMLLRVWMSLLESGAPQRHHFRLVFVGRPGWMTEALQETMRADPRLRGWLVVLQGVDDRLLDRLYRDAAFCLYPSIYEGFGLPVAEAFARGKAVLASTGGALAELAAGFSPPLDPLDEAAWRSWIEAWMADPAARAPYEAAIRERFAAPTWREAAARFFAAVLDIPPRAPAGDRRAAAMDLAGPALSLDIGDHLSDRMTT